MMSGHARAFLLIAALFASPGLAQNSTASSKPEPVDVYDFGYPAVYTPRYQHDPDDRKRITNPDFFCTRCAKEGRIAAKTRDDMKDALEFVKHYPAELEGKKSETFGAYRMMEQEAMVVLGKLLDDPEAEDPIFIEDGFFRLFADLPSFHLKMPPYLRREYELQQLADIFPDVSEKTIMIDPHLRAHLYLFRAHRIRQEFQNLVGYDPKAPYMDYKPYFMGMRQKWELYVFGKKKTCKDFVDSFLGQTIDDGICWHLLRERGMVMIVHGDRRKDVELHNSFTCRLAYNMLFGFRAYEYDLPAWLGLGYAHLMERRERTDFNTFIFGEGQTPEIGAFGKWKVMVKKDILADKVRPFAEYADKENLNEIRPSEHPHVWSLTSYLLQLDQKKFGVMINILKERQKGETMRNLLTRALRTAYGMTINEIDQKWREWVKATYPLI